MIALLPHRDTRTEAAAPSVTPADTARDRASEPAAELPGLTDPTVRPGVELGKEHSAVRPRPVW